MSSLYNPNFLSGAGGSSLIPVPSSNSSPVFVRVVDIILDDTHPEWNKFGKTDSIGVIKYKNLSINTSEEKATVLLSAYPIENYRRIYPLKNEIVTLVNGPTTDLDSSSKNRKVYYESVVNLWNHPNHNAFPQDTSQEVDLGEDVSESADVNLLQPYPGDIIYQGRLGNSLRFTGYKSSKSINVDGSNNGKPLTILTNGLTVQENPFDLVSENINTDDSSIWLTSNHVIPLVSRPAKVKSYTEIPISPQAYKGRQILINSDRVVINSREDSILLRANKSVGLSAETVNLDGNRYLALDAKEIYLGEKSLQGGKGIAEPVLKGHQTEFFLEQLLGLLSDMAADMTAATTVDGQPIPLLNKRGVIMTTLLTSLSKRINPNGSSPLKSKKVFTE